MNIQSFMVHPLQISPYDIVKKGVEILKICVLSDLCNVGLVFVYVVHAEQECAIIYGLPLADKPL